MPGGEGWWRGEPNYQLLSTSLPVLLVIVAVPLSLLVSAFMFFLGHASVRLCCVRINGSDSMRMHATEALKGSLTEHAGSSPKSPSIDVVKASSAGDCLVLSIEVVSHEMQFFQGKVR